MRFTTLNSDEPTKGTFEMDDNTVVITYDNGNSDEYVWDKENNTLDWMGSGIMIFEKK